MQDKLLGAALLLLLPSHLRRKRPHLKSHPPSGPSFTSLLLGSGAQLSGRHKGTVGSPEKSPKQDGGLLFLTLDLGVKGVGVPRS